MYNSQAKRVRQGGEINSGEVLVETAGYISKERRIKSLIAAGVRLEELRKQGAFDTPAGEEFDPEKIKVNPLRNPGFDIADAHMFLQDLKVRTKKFEDFIKSENEKKVEKEKVDKKGDAKTLDKSKKVTKAYIEGDPNIPVEE